MYSYVKNALTDESVIKKVTLMNQFTDSNITNFSIADFDISDSLNVRDNQTVSHPANTRSKRRGVAKAKCHSPLQCKMKGNPITGECLRIELYQ